jgi:phosphonate metabolism protein PhnN/1,5-bisphosphokinase (PRPP-forming)
MSGQWVLVCGASGAGKDSVMAWAAAHLADQPKIVFARRVVTREPHPGSDHDAVTAQEFDDLLAADALAWHWRAHGFGYGIAARYAAQVAAGGVVVVNGSREHAATVTPAQSVRVVNIIATPEQLERRMAQRGRDAPQDISKRLQRNTRFEALRADRTILNQHTLAQAGQELADYLLSIS